MISADHFLAPARKRGFDFYTGVPCSFLTPIINRVISDSANRPGSRYVGATSEGEAVAIAAGAWLAGRRSVVMCQNSGLGNTVNPLTSLNHPFRIPVLLIVTWRGQPGLEDEPQHDVMGEITGALLDTMKIPHRPFPSDPADVAPALDAAEAAMAATGLPFALIMEKGSVADDGLEQPQPAPTHRGQWYDRRGRGGRPARAEVLARFLERAPEDTAVIATTGKCGRELFTLADRPQHLYQVGSMGCASAMGLGVALNANNPVVVLDGDGAALMKMGSLATIGHEAPGNLIHIVLDNGVHDSTGGQATVSAGVDFAEVALACGYAAAFSCDDIDGFATAFEKASADQTASKTGPVMIHARIAPGSMAELGRPTVKPPEVAARFKKFLAG